MPVPILHRDDAYRLHFKAGFFQNLFFCIGSHRLQHITPAAGQRPCAVVFVHQQNFVFRKNGCPCINLRRLISCLIAKQTLNLFHRNLCLFLNYFCRDPAQTFIPLNIIYVIRISQPGLCQTLNLHRPGQPLFHLSFSFFYAFIDRSTFFIPPLFPLIHSCAVYGGRKNVSFVSPNILRSIENAS